MHRREMLHTCAGVLLGAAAGSCWAEDTAAEDTAADANAERIARFQRQRVCVFTDHLDDGGYSYEEIARQLRQLGVAGPDLTVRGGGVVAPQRAAEELPRAAAVFAEHDLTIPMLTTNLTSARDEAARPLLSTMSKLGIKFFKLGYYPYNDLARWSEQLEAARAELSDVVQLAREVQVVAGLHNHAGPTVGGALWDGVELLRPLAADAVGFYFDPAHAMIEGGKVGWKLHLARIAPRLTMVALKDFVWEKRGGQWTTRWCPLGQGMVDWAAFFAQLATLDFRGPLSLHIEYDPGGRTPAERFDNALAAAQQDLAFLRQHLGVLIS